MYNFDKNIVQLNNEYSLFNKFMVICKTLKTFSIVY